jgi:hypothetical protein
MSITALRSAWRIGVSSLLLGGTAWAGAPPVLAGAAPATGDGRLLVAHAGGEEGHEHGAATAGKHAVIVALPADRMPQVHVTLDPDDAGGWHLSLETENFRFLGGEAAGNEAAVEGHAHVYVDGAEVAHFDAPKFDLPPLPAGVHVVEVNLATAGHQLYGGEDGRIAGERFVILVEQQGQVFKPPLEVHDIAVAHGALSGGEDTIHAVFGDTVAIRWTVDEPGELHLHGYDIEAEASPAMSTTMVFAANSYGRFPVERHGAAEESAILWIEVMP